MRMAARSAAITARKTFPAVPLARLPLNHIIGSTSLARLVEAPLDALQFSQDDPVGLREVPGVLEEIIDIFFDIFDVLGDLLDIFFDLLQVLSDLSGGSTQQHALGCCGNAADEEGQDHVPRPLQDHAEQLATVGLGRDIPVAYRVDGGVGPVDPVEEANTLEAGERDAPAENPDERKDDSVGEQRDRPEAAQDHRQHVDEPQEPQDPQGLKYAG